MAKKTPKTTVIETLSIEKYQKELEDIKAKRFSEREAMRKKLEKGGYKFQKDVVKVEKKFNKKKKEGTLTDKDILEAFICLELTPMIHAATIHIRSSNEKVLHDLANTQGDVDVHKARIALPGSWSMTSGFMALLEEPLEKYHRRIKQFYKDLYSEK